jgi:hypothetical protein
MADLVAKLLQRSFFTMNSFICAIPKKEKEKEKENVAEVFPNSKV